MRHRHNNRSTLELTMLERCGKGSWRRSTQADLVTASTRSRRHSAHVLADVSQDSIHPSWKACWHGVTLIRSEDSHISRQIGHSPWKRRPSPKTCSLYARVSSLCMVFGGAAHESGKLPSIT